MPSGDRLLAFTVTALVIVLIPGPSVLFTVSRALTVGRRAALFCVGGNAVGALLQVIAVAFGVGAIVQRSVEIFTAIKLAGAAYLVYLGVQAIRHRRSLTQSLAGTVRGGGARRMFGDGVLVGATNPKVIVFLVAVLPQFVDRTAGPVTSQLLILGAVFPVIAVSCDSVWALAAGRARRWLVGSPRRMAAIGGAGGLAMIGIGTRLAFVGRHD